MGADKKHADFHQRALYMDFMIRYFFSYFLFRFRLSAPCHDSLMFFHLIRRKRESFIFDPPIKDFMGIIQNACSLSPSFWSSKTTFKPPSGSWRNLIIFYLHFTPP